MERYVDNWVIVKDTKMCDDSRELFDDCGWIKRIPIAVVGSYDAAQEFISNRENLEYHLRRLIDDEGWELHPDSNENHRTYVKYDNHGPYEGKVWFVKFHCYSVGYYK